MFVVVVSSVLFGRFSQGSFLNAFLKSDSALAPLEPVRGSRVERALSVSSSCLFSKLSGVEIVSARRVMFDALVVATMLETTVEVVLVLVAVYEYYRVSSLN